MPWARGNHIGPMNFRFFFAPRADLLLDVHPSEDGKSGDDSALRRRTGMQFDSVTDDRQSLLCGQIGRPGN